MRAKSTLLFLLVGAFSLCLSAQTAKQFSVKNAAAAPLIDGLLNEPLWQTAEPITGFWRNFPDDTTAAHFQTTVWLVHDREHLYVAARMERNAAEGYAVTTLKEDFVFYENDAFGIILDPFSDFTNGYGFYVNAYGTRLDEQISGGSMPDPTIDLKWQAETHRSAEFWTVEIAIPLKYLRHKGSDTWNINFVRTDRGANERTAWVRTPIQFLLGNLAFSGKMHWENPLEQSQKLYSIIPSLTLSSNRERGKDGELKAQPSLDAKIAIGTSLNLDLTINPDFSQAEVDKVQLNLTRFELDFPENRLFFTENSDLFAQFGDVSWGNPPARPFYSRRVGLRFDDEIQGYVQTKILGGARLSGKINEDWRLGAMTLLTGQEKLQTANEGAFAYSPVQNYSVLAVQRKMFSRSNLAAMLVQRQAFGTDSTEHFALNRKDYNTLPALEYNFATKNDQISGKAFYHLSLKPGEGKTPFARGFLLRHNTYRWRNWAQFVQVSPGFQPDAGFVPRPDAIGLNFHLAYSIYPKKGRLARIEFLTNPQFFLRSEDGKFMDRFVITGINIVSKKTVDFWLVHINERVTLRAPFDPSLRNKGETLNAGMVYDFDYLRLAYTTDRRRPLYWQMAIDAGGYYHGSQVRTDGELGYRLQPWGILALNYNVGFLRFPEPFSDHDFWYLGPKLELSLSRSVFFTTVLQYNSLAENLNLYARFQWRFRPLSDFFLIYSGNQQVQPNEFRNRQVILKTVMWI